MNKWQVSYWHGCHKAKRENEKNGVKTTSGSTRNGQSQAVADRAYNANSFKEYVNVDDIATSALLGGFGEGLSWGASKIIPAADLMELPKADFFPALFLDALVEVDINIIQFFFDFDYSPSRE